MVVIEYEHIPYYLRITNRHLIDRANGRVNTEPKSGPVMRHREFTAETAEEEELVSLMEEMFDE